MSALKRILIATAAATALACTPLAPAAAGVHGFGRGGLGWGFGRGLFGAAAALVTLPIVIASAAISAATSAAPAPQQPAYARHARVVTARLDDILSIVKHRHRTKLVDHKFPIVETNPPLTKYRWTWAFQLDCESRDQKKWREQNQRAER